MAAGGKVLEPRAARIVTVAFHRSLEIGECLVGRSRKSLWGKRQSQRMVRYKVQIYRCMNLRACRPAKEIGGCGQTYTQGPLRGPRGVAAG
jgi:hypothetical protein